MHNPHGGDIDHIVATLAQPGMDGWADDLLDLRQAARTRTRAGTCVKTYFDLLACTRAGLGPGLADLRGWLETNLQIAVRDAADLAPLDQLPVTLTGESDLESFCRKAIHQVRADRCHQAAELRLEFDYAPVARGAVC